MQKAGTSAMWLVILAAVVASPVHSARAQHARAPRVTLVRHDSARRVDVLVDGQPFTSYIWPTTIRKPVLYPVRAASGVVVTRGFPLEARPGERTDHPHQVGMWLTYENVNGLDFWNNSDAIPASRAPKMGTIVQRAIRDVRGGAGEGRLDVSAEWVDHTGKALLREDTRFVFRAAPGLRSIDRITTLTALGDTVRFNDAKDGMFGMRVARSLEQPEKKTQVFTDAAGATTRVAAMDTAGVTGWYRSSEGLEGDSVWATHARWTTLEGSVAGKPVTIAMLDNPKNFGFPTLWHARGYGLYAANPIGQKAFGKGDARQLVLEPGGATTFRYRVLLLDGHATPRDIERYYREWAR